jgi:hypothetical protein
MVPLTATDIPTRTDTIARIRSFIFLVFTPRYLACSSPREKASNSLHIKSRTAVPARKNGSIRRTWVQPLPEKDPMDQKTTCLRLSLDKVTRRLVRLLVSMEKITPVRIMVCVERPASTLLVKAKIRSRDKKENRILIRARPPS